MKKIVAGIAALAMAASVFAVDVASMIQIDGSLMSYDKTNGFKAIMAKDYDPSGSSDYVWKLSTSGDKSGAEIWSWATTTDIVGSISLNDDKSFKEFNTAAVQAKTLSQYSIWFKPADWLKVTVGNVYASSCVNPQFGWWAKEAEFSKYGYQFDMNFDALSITASLGAGQGNNWFNAKADGYAKIGDFWLDARYVTDYGTVQAYVTKGSGIHPHGFTGWDASDLAIGAAWGNCGYMQNGYYVEATATFINGPISETQSNPWADASAADRDDGFAFEKVVGSVYGQYFINGFGFQMINLVKFTPASMQRGAATGWAWKKGDAEFKYGFEFKGTYAMDGWTPYIQIDGYSIMDKSMTVDLGVSTSVGGCSISAWADFPITFSKDYSFNFSVPVEFTVNL